MTTYITEEVNKKYGKVIVYHSGSRETPIYIGAKYVCEPLNPLKLKNRGRQGTLIEFCQDEDIGLAQWEANIKWDDTKRVGKVDILDLVLLEM